MDDSPGHADRADAVHQVSQTIARGAFQILRAALRAKPFQTNGKSAQRQRGYRDADGGADDVLDMRCRCIVCGAELWPCTARKVYCSRRCIARQNTILEREARAEALASRRCETCDALMPLTMRADARWCSLRCKRASGPNYYRGTRTCGWCGTAFRAVNKGQTACSISCGQHLRQSRRKG